MSDQEIDYLADSDEDVAEDVAEDVVEDAAENAFQFDEPLQWESEGADAKYLAKKIIEPNGADPNNFSTVIDSKVQGWLDSGKYIRRNLRRNYLSLVRKIHIYFQTGNGLPSTFTRAIGILDQAGRRPDGLPGFVEMPPKKKTAKKKTSRTTPVRGGGDEEPTAAATTAANAAATATDAMGDVLMSLQNINLDPRQHIGAPTIIVKIFQSDDPDSPFRRLRRRVSILAIAMSGCKPEDIKIAQKQVPGGTRIAVRWRLPNKMCMADFLLGSIAAEDPDMADAVEPELQKLAGQWQLYEFDLGMQLEGFFRIGPSLQPAGMHEQHRRWNTPPDRSRGGAIFQAFCTMVTAFEVALDNGDNRYEEYDDYGLVNMTEDHANYSNDMRRRNSYFNQPPAAAPAAYRTPPRQQRPTFTRTPQTPQTAPRPRTTPRSNTSHHGSHSAPRPRQQHRQQQQPRNEDYRMGRDRGWSKEEERRRNEDYADYLTSNRTQTAGAKSRRPAGEVEMSERKPRGNRLKPPAPPTMKKKTPTRPPPPKPVPPPPPKVSPKVSTVPEQEAKADEMEVDGLPKTSFEEENSGRYYNKKPFGGMDVSNSTPPHSNRRSPKRSHEDIMFSEQNEYEPPEKKVSFEEEDESNKVSPDDDDDGGYYDYGDNYGSDSTETESDDDRSKEEVEYSNWLRTRNDYN
ncbi:expressed unknown protein [Seminavis robusta]|uniref:Uncharacterized protein n=1 Tax=Seminavis robusta TaxID=568900 RepID=A0A9N8ERD5_9STRA|nr:expressed unknown protein [Seminavis robusta]|eukprot:Sro1738_g294550.1 n/a (683) ;mRNA; r:18604-20726